MISLPLPYLSRKYIKTLFLLCFCISGIDAQSISKSILSAGGQYEENSNINLQWTLGEIAIEAKADIIGINEGFHAGISPLISTSSNYISNFQLNLYPNPAKEILYINHNWKGKFEFSIYNLCGIKLFQDINSTVDLQHFLPGMYVIQVTDSKGHTFSGRFIKN
jgi:hypothetical protein